MASVSAGKSHSYSANKFRPSRVNNISLDANRVSSHMNNTNSLSPSSITSASTIERSPKYRHRILSSTLKNDHSNVLFKRRFRYYKLLHHTQIINRKYMISMANILFQMQKQLNKLKRRTQRVEQLVIKQTKTVQPIIRIPRLTKDQLSIISVNYDVEDIPEENIAISDNNNNEIPIIETTKSKPIKRLNKHKHPKTSMKLSARRRPRIWINNRQKPIDPDKYCSLCRYEYSKRSNFLVHVRNVHKGRIPPKINEQDQSLLEMNEENLQENSHQRTNETTNDQSVMVANNEVDSLEIMANQWDMHEGRLRPRTSAKPGREKFVRVKVKCDICCKFFRADYLKKHKRGAHPDQEVLSYSSEINNNSDQTDSVSDKPTEQYHSSNENPISVEELHTPTAATPTTVTIATMDTDDIPIRFRADANKPIVIAVTCLETYQLDLVEQFVEKFSSFVCQSTSIDSRTTHLITNDEQHPLRSPLSMKLIEAIAHHCFCVSYRWIIDCLKYDRIVDEVSYEIEGDDTEIHPHGGPRRSRLIPTRHSLFQDICFMIKCTENSDIRMTNERLEDLITTCGGQIITCVTQRLLDTNKIIVLCDMLYVSERRHNYDQCRSLGIHFVSSDWVLESILEYCQKPFSLFEEVPL